MPKRAIPHQFTPGHAAYIVRRAIEDHKITAADIRRYTDGIEEEIRELEERLAELQDAAGRAAKSAIAKASGWASSGGRAAKRARRKVVSAARRASQQLQGQYLGFMRQIPEKQRAEFKRIATEEGREKAIAAMKKALGK